MIIWTTRLDHSFTRRRILLNSWYPWRQFWLLEKR